MKIARISYANTEPFFHHWPTGEFTLQPGVPKELADAARRGEVIAGPLPLVECWALEDEFVPLGPWGIAAREKSRSVFVLSRQPFSELDHMTIGVTKESATSVVLCETLIREKYRNTVTIRKGLNLEDTAWLVIGDQALHLSMNPAANAWPYITDLASEWWGWKQLPFVFARWVVRRDLDQSLREQLNRCVEKSFRKGMDNLPALAQAISIKMNLPPEFLVHYLHGLVYELDTDAEKSNLIFRELAEKSSTSLVA